jgi:hypothetical protein
MKVLFINLCMHNKNLESLYSYGFDIDNVTDPNLDNIDLAKYDIVYSPSVPINVKKYPKTKFIFGPHFSVFPNEQQINMITNNNSIYIQPSIWTLNLWKNFKICENLLLKSIPFSVNTKKFNEDKPINERNNIFIYFKRRNPVELELIKKYLNNYNIKYRIFDYVQRYNEKEYLDYLHDSKYGIWLDAHESQGFALEEALACNIPLLVWNVNSMSQEFGSNYWDFSATTIPYWDDRCGEYFTEFINFEKIFAKFISKLDTYKPREYILENLSSEICSKLFRELHNII